MQFPQISQAAHRQALRIRFTGRMQLADIVVKMRPRLFEALLVQAAHHSKRIHDPIDDFVQIRLLQM